MNVNLIAGVLVVSFALAACGNSTPVATQVGSTASQTSALTQEQVAVLAGDEDENVVRDAVDGGIVAKL